MSESKSITIEIDRNLCKGCGICVASCKYSVLRMSDTRGRQGYLVPEVVALRNCKKCMLCEMVCPDLAIEIKN